MSNDTITALRKAVEISPDNVPLRIHLAETLHSMTRYEEAQSEFTTALSMAPDNSTVKLGLANTFYQLGKYMQALVITEDLLAGPNGPAAAYVLHSRLLLNEGQVKEAVTQYKQAIKIDASVGDETLSSRLGIGADQGSPVVDGRVRAGVDDRGTLDQDVERSNVKFSDIGGMDQVKEQIRVKIIYPIANPDVYKAYGKKIGGGILMYGPPGCGKTHLARATAGEINAGFINVGITDVLNMWIGESERNLHELFSQARRNSPCVLFFDEVDALAAKRQSDKTSGQHVATIAKTRRK